MLTHYVRALDDLHYKIDFPETLHIFYFCPEMDKNAFFLQFFTFVSMAALIFYF